MTQNRKIIRIIILIAGLGVFATILLYSRLMGKVSISHDGYNFALTSVYITGDEDDFFGYEEGILVPGKLFDEYKAENGLEDDAKPSYDTDANFNHKEWIREAAIRIVSPEGKEVLSDKAGVRVSGNASRKLEQKSLLLLADKKYGSGRSTFCYDFGDGTKEYKKIKVHSGGQDLRDTQLRDELVGYIEKLCGIKIVRSYVPAVVYINNEFYGIAHLEPALDENYIADFYGIKKNDVYMVDGGMDEFLEEIGYENKAYDFNDEKLRSDFEQKVDVQDFLKYIAFNLIIRNYDWPMNNVSAYKYTGKLTGDESIKNGKYRFVVSDVDVAFKNDADDPFVILDYSDESEYMKFIKSLLEYQPYRDQFLNIVLDDLSVAFDENDLALRLAEINLSYQDVFEYAADKSPFEDVRGYCSNHDNSVAELHDKLLSRKGEVYSHVYQYYNTGKGYNLEVIPADGVSFLASTVLIESDREVYNSIRSCGCSVPIFVKKSDGTAADHILVNGEWTNLENGYIKISAEDALDGQVCISY